LRKHPSTARTTQVAFLAMNREGEVGAYAIQHGFSYAVCDAENPSALIPSASVFPA
jgi:N4-(beta-N-acetylglucosaminyl)-L-asparaginase